MLVRILRDLREDFGGDSDAPGHDGSGDSSTFTSVRIGNIELGASQFADILSDRIRRATGVGHCQSLYCTVHARLIICMLRVVCVYGRMVWLCGCERWLTLGCAARCVREGAQFTRRGTCARYGRGAHFRQTATRRT